MELTVRDKTYKIEFTVEASLCDECVEKTTSLMVDIGKAQNANDIEELIKSITNVPKTALAMLYGGLQEHHGIDADGTVTSIADAKQICKDYFADNKDDENANFYGILTMCLEQMGNDGFFKQIGIDQMMNAEKPKKKVVPKDHLRKQKKEVIEN